MQAPTEAQIVAAARALSDDNADVCNVNREDNWMIYGDSFRETARVALRAALACRPDAQESLASENVSKDFPPKVSQGLAQADERGAFDIALNALQRYQDEWDTGLPSEYAQSERIQMECACEAVREALQEARAAAPAPVSEPSPDREQVGEAAGLSYQSRALLLNVLWHHQGGSSTVGQPIRTMLGIGQYDHLTEEQLSEAKRIEGMLAWHEAPDALPFRECGERQGAAQSAHKAVDTLRNLDGWLCNSGYDADHPWRLSIARALASAPTLGCGDPGWQARHAQPQAPELKVSIVQAGLTGLARHVRACSAYSKLIGDMEIVDQAIALLERCTNAQPQAAEPKKSIGDFLDAPKLFTQVYCCAVFVFGCPSDMALSVAREAVDEFGDDPSKSVADLEAVLSEVLRTY